MDFERTNPSIIFAFIKTVHTTDSSRGTNR